VFLKLEEGGIGFEKKKKNKLARKGICPKGKTNSEDNWNDRGDKTGGLRDMTYGWR
jgi:hypothetical protein